MIRRQLLSWYARSHRPLPWRQRQDDTYAQWLAEIMLQQTQVATVIPYYLRFMKRFPTVGHLARVDRRIILDMWAGLGFYRRAHRLHDAAKMVMGEFAGRFPDSVEHLVKLPGVGRSTAGAIASIAHDRRAPVLDGNVERVLRRFLKLKPTANRETLWRVAERLMPRRRCGQFNQALMELGATVCKPKNPTCQVCPLRRTCRSVGIGIVDHPRPAGARRAVVEIKLAVLAVTGSEHVLIRRRDATGLWAGMWEVPCDEWHDSSLDPLVHRLLPAGVCQRVGPWNYVGNVIHQLTHRRVTFRVYHSRARRVRVSARYQWQPIQDTTALPRAFAKVTDLVRCWLAENGHPIPCCHRTSC